jgi:hypothetical protein
MRGFLYNLSITNLVIDSFRLKFKFTKDTVNKNIDLDVKMSFDGKTKVSSIWYLIFKLYMVISCFIIDLINIYFIGSFISSLIFGSNFNYNFFIPFFILEFINIMSLLIYKYKK